MGKQFRASYSAYGAPMGRTTYGDQRNFTKFRLFRVKLNKGGYDDGGAYWGIGKPLWCAMSEHAIEGEDYYRDFVRASTRELAASLLGIDDRLWRKK